MVERILGNDFMEMDLVKWFYDANRYWQMILGKWFLFIYWFQKKEREKGNVSSVEICI
jgi:hypothetical protein